MYDQELTKKILGDVGPLRFNPYVIKVCEGCGKQEKKRYKGFGKPSDPYYCRSCVVNRPEIKEKLSDATTKQWKDPEFRQTVVNSSIAIWDDPERRKKMDRIRTDPTFKEMHQANLAKLNTEANIAKRLSQHANVSGIQLTLYSILDDLGIQYFKERTDGQSDPECIIGPYSFDCVIPRKNKTTLLVECQGDYWHNLPSKIQLDKAKASYIDNNLSDKYELKTIWEHEFKQKDRIINLVRRWVGLSAAETIDFNFDDVEIKICPAAEYRPLLSKYHYLANAGRGGTAYGAYLNGELIAVCVFSSLSRQNLPHDYSATKDLSRLCIHPDYQKPNFGSWFVSRCIKQLPESIKTIISYCDTTFDHDGALYKACNFTYSGEVPPDYWYVSKEGWVMHKKTLYEHARGLKMTETEFADKNGYMKVYGKKKLRFIYIR